MELQHLVVLHGDGSIAHEESVATPAQAHAIARAVVERTHQPHMTAFLTTPERASMMRTHVYDPAVARHPAQAIGHSRRRPEALHLADYHEQPPVHPA